VDGFERDAASFERDDFVKVQARVESYRSKLQIAIDKIRRAEESEWTPPISSLTLLKMWTSFTQNSLPSSPP